MANFRCERAYVMLDEPVPGLDHLKAIDAEAFARLLSDEMSHWMTEAGLTPLVDFLFAPFDRPKWRPASKGLRSVRGAMGFYQEWLGAETNPCNWPRDRMERELAVLAQVEAVLDAADTRDRRFHFAGRDLR